jgi:STE24 endopeptidase
MNAYAAIILFTLLGAQLIEWITDYLNIRAIREKLPEEFADTYDESVYRRSQEYLRVNTRFDAGASMIDLAIVLAFWFSGGFAWLDDRVRSMDLGAIPSGLIFIGILLASRSLLALPFSIYRTFNIEARFGFNKTTPKVFITDRMKGLLLGLAIGGPILTGVLWFFETAGSMAWLYCWAAVTVVGLVLQYIAPTWIMPLFNKFTPLEDGELKTSILDLARRVGFPLREITVMDGSKRSSKSNAFFTGFGKNKRIALFDTLIRNHTVDELTAVVAHEIGHYKKRHIVKGMIVAFFHTGAMLFLLSFFIQERGLFDAFYVDHPSVYAGLVFFGMLFSPVELLLGIAMNVVSRRHEFEADRFAAESTGRPNALIDGLKKLSRDNLSNLTPHPAFVFVNYSHPPVLERIRALQGNVKEVVHA